MGSLLAKHNKAVETILSNERKEHDKIVSQFIEKIQILESKLDQVSASIGDGLSRCETQLKEISEQAASKPEKSRFELSDDLRESIKKYMMENYNISWVSDSVEENVYDTILSIVFKSVNAIV